MFSFFERLVDPYPDSAPEPPPRGFFPFLWACTVGLRRYLLVMTLLTAVIGAFEALLFSMLGHVVDWLARVKARAAALAAADDLAADTARALTPVAR